MGSKEVVGVIIIHKSDYYSLGRGADEIVGREKRRRVEKPNRKRNQAKGGTALAMNLMMRRVFTSQSNEKIRVGGEEAMKPDLESLKPKE